jgi:hypothetical protein
MPGVTHSLPILELYAFILTHGSNLLFANLSARRLPRSGRGVSALSFSEPYLPPLHARQPLVYPERSRGVTRLPRAVLTRGHFFCPFIFNGLRIALFGNSFVFTLIHHCRGCPPSAPTAPPNRVQDKAWRRSSARGVKQGNGGLWRGGGDRGPGAARF